jgi:hypothetical protein
MLRVVFHLNLKGLGKEIQKCVGQEAMAVVLLRKKPANRFLQLYRWQKKFAPKNAIVTESLMQASSPLSDSLVPLPCH